MAWSGEYSPGSGNSREDHIMMPRYMGRFLSLPISLLTTTAISLIASFSATSQAQPLPDHDVMPVVPMQAQARPLIPDADAAATNPFDGYLRQAALSAAYGKFDDAIIQFQRADKLASNKCEHQHAQAGAISATTAKQTFKQYGWKSKPTQLFYGKFQSLTQSLACVQQP